MMNFGARAALAGLAAITLATTATPATAATNLVVGGSFETPFNVNPWNRNFTSPFVLDWGSASEFRAPTDGLFYLRFTAFLTGFEMSIWQTIATTPGTNYLLSFDAASGLGGGVNGKQFAVSWTPFGDPNQAFVVPRQTITNTEFQTYSFPLVATSAQSVLRFSFWGEFDNGFLDNVVLTEFSPGDPTGVPEPVSWTLLIAGFGLVGAAARQRRPAGA